MPALIQRATSDLPERPRFALDEAGPEGEDEEDELPGRANTADRSLMADVDAFLECVLLGRSVWDLRSPSFDALCATSNPLS